MAGNLVDVLPEVSPIVTAIFQAYEKSRKKFKSRRVTASRIGKACSRQGWLEFRHCSTSPHIDGRILRLFQTGNHEEPRFNNELRGIGCQVATTDDQGKQFKYYELDGHFTAKIDGGVLGLPGAEKTWHCMEQKTHNKKNFGKVVNNGLQKAFPDHYAQLIMGMALSKMKRGLYLCKNKDDDDLYAERFRWEQVKADATFYWEKAQRIITAKVPPKKISEKRDHFECRYCEFQNLCHGDPGNTELPAVPAAVSCRNCIHATPVMGEADNFGAWRCEKYKTILSWEKQDRACPAHVFIPELIRGAVPIDIHVDGDFITYQKHAPTTDLAKKAMEVFDGHSPVFTNGHGKKLYDSWTLAQIPDIMVGE